MRRRFQIVATIPFAVLTCVSAEGVIKDPTYNMPPAAAAVMDVDGCSSPSDGYLAISS